jgi:hypothetical protein
MQPDTHKMLACLDLTGSKRPWDLVWVKGENVGHKKFRKRSKQEDFYAWVKENKPLILAIDAPSGYNLKRTLDPEIRKARGWDKSYKNMRLCEADLREREIKLYFTPADAVEAAAWIQCGWQVYDRLKKDFGYKLYDRTGAVKLGEERVLIEVHPHACYVVGLGWIPQDKGSVPGQLERIAYLLGAARNGDKPWVGQAMPPVRFLETLVSDLQGLTWDIIRDKGVKIAGESHDKLDALAGLVTAAKAREGTSYAVGDPAEGVIVLPAEPASSYSAKRQR